MSRYWLPSGVLVTPLEPSYTPRMSNFADLLHRLGDIPPNRIRCNPVPGTATLDDLLKPENAGCELVEGTLIDRPADFLIACTTPLLISWLFPAAREGNRGIVTNGLGPIEILPGTVRRPDLAFTPWSRLPGRRIPSDPIPAVVPELWVTCWRIGNTHSEMARKRGEYFRSGVLLVWEIDPRARTVRVYTSETAFTDLTAVDTLDGGTVLPGFTLPIAQLFAELDRHG
jgi:Uma2 family endonuclease